VNFKTLDDEMSMYKRRLMRTMNATNSCITTRVMKTYKNRNNLEQIQRKCEWSKRLEICVTVSKTKYEEERKWYIQND
jgi:hypothetical protein